MSAVLSLLRLLEERDISFMKRQYIASGDGGLDIRRPRLYDLL